MKTTLVSAIHVVVVLVMVTRMCWWREMLWCVQTVSGLRLVDTFLKRTYEHDELAQVIVFDNEDVIRHPHQQQQQHQSVVTISPVNSWHTAMTVSAGHQNHREAGCHGDSGRVLVFSRSDPDVWFCACSHSEQCFSAYYKTRKAIQPERVKNDTCQSVFSLMWPWPLTPKLKAWCRCLVDHLCHLAWTSVDSCSKYSVHKFGNRWTDLLTLDERIGW